MTSFNTDNISRKQKKELSRLRGQHFGIRFIASLAAVIALIVIGLSYISPGGVDVNDRDYGMARRALASNGWSWSAELLEKQAQYADWLSKHGTGFESRLFESYSRALFDGVSKISGERTSLSFASRAYLSLVFAALRIGFILIACWRIWLVVVVLATVRSYFLLRPYRRNDALGQTGNGRLYYSGIRAALDDVDERGRPRLQVAGLACPRYASPVKTKTSELGQALIKYGVANKTNLGLAAIIVEHYQWPAYIAEREEQALMSQMFEEVGLAENTLHLLKAAMDLHAWYANSEEALAQDMPGDMVLPISGQNSSGPIRKVKVAEYSHLMRSLFHRVLTLNLRAQITRISKEELATLVMAYEAGKVLTHSYEGGRWLLRSNFPQLNARAVLHSIPHFSEEYTLGQREDLRKALIYGSRRSVFAPVRFALDLSESGRAMRQWVELLMSCPHQVQSVADEVELVGLMAESHAAWLAAFFDGAMLMNPEVVDGVYASSTGLLFMPVTKLVKIMRRVLNPDVIRRIETLTNLVNQKQRMQNLSGEVVDEAGERVNNLMQDKFLAPLSFKEIKDLAALHSIAAEDLRDWSSFRVILNSYSWLARRVGDCTVPESSIVFAVLSTEDDLPEANELGLIGKSAMVPLRASRLVARWGKSWASRFVQVGLSNMAEDKERFDRLMKGESDTFDEDMLDGAGGMQPS